MLGILFHIFAMDLVYEIIRLNIIASSIVFLYHCNATGIILHSGTTYIQDYSWCYAVGLYRY